MLKIYETKQSRSLSVIVVSLDSEEREQQIDGTSIRWTIECRECGYHEPQSKSSPIGYSSLDSAINRFKSLPNLDCDCDKEQV